MDVYLSPQFSSVTPHLTQAAESVISTSAALLLSLHCIKYYILFLIFFSPTFELLSAAEKNPCNHKYAAGTSFWSSSVLDLYQKVLNLYASFISSHLSPVISSTASNLYILLSPLPTLVLQEMISSIPLSCQTSSY